MWGVGLSIYHHNKRGEGEIWRERKREKKGRCLLVKSGDFARKRNNQRSLRNTVAAEANRFVATL